MVKRGEIYALEIGDKTRPVLVIQTDILNRNLNTTLVIPFSSQTSRAKFDNTVYASREMTGLNEDSVLTCSEIFVIKQDELHARIGVVQDELTILHIETSLQYVLGIIPQSLI